MTEVNEARFTIEGTPSEDPTTGNRGYVAIHSQTIDVTLETNPSPALYVMYEVYDPTDSDSPLSSLDAPLLTWIATGTSKQVMTSPNGTASIIMPASGTHSYVIRCTVSLASGSETFERVVAIERTDTSPHLRKTTPGESEQYRARGYSDDLNDLVDAMGGGGGGGSENIDDTYNNFGSGAAIVHVDGSEGQGDLRFDIVTDHSICIDLANTDGVVDGFQVYDGAATEYWRLIRKGNNIIDLEAALQNVGYSLSGTYQVSSVGATLTSTDADLNLICAGATGGDIYLTNSTAAQDIFFAARASGNIPFNEAAPDNVLVGFTHISLIGVLNELKAGVGAVTLDVAYNNSAGPAVVTVDSGDVSWNLTGACSHNISLVGVNNAADGAHVENGADFYRLNWAAADQIAFTSELQTYDLNVEGALTIDSLATFSIDGVGASNLSTTSGNLTLSTITSGELKFISAGLLTLSDGFKSASTYSSDLVLSDAAAEWSTFESNFGEVSLLNALNQCATSVVTLDEAYNASAGASIITVDVGDVTWNQTNAFSFVINLAGCTGSGDGFFVTTGTDQFNLTRIADNAMSVDIDSYAYEIDAATTGSLTATGALTVGSISYLRLNGSNIGVNTATFGTAMAGGIAILNGTAGSGTLADTTRIWAADRGATAGKSSLHIACEDGVLNVIGDRAGFGTALPAAQVHSYSTTEQLRLGYNDSYFASHVVTSSNSYKITSTGLLALEDGFYTGSTYDTDFVLSDSSAEWSAFETKFGEVSLLNAITQCIIVPGITDHGALGGLADDDHTQYVLLNGRSGGQIVIGGTAVTDDLILRATSGIGASGSDIILQVGNNGATEAIRCLYNGNVGIKTAAPSYDFVVTGNVAITGEIRVGAGADPGTSGYVLKSAGASAAPTWSAISTLDHGGLGGLGDDDHSQYALLAGRSGGQVLIGGTGTTDDLTLRATAGIGASGSDIIFQVGNNGATEAARILYDGQFNIVTGNVITGGSADLTLTPAGSYIRPKKDIFSDRWGTNSSTNTAYGVGVFGNNGLTHGSGNEGWYNVGIGKDCLKALTTGNLNLAAGSFSMALATTAIANVALGYGAMYSCIDGGANVALGYNALYSVTSGASNFALGYAAVYSLSSGAYNIGIGDSCLNYITTQQYNIAIGRAAGQYITGAQNIFIGGLSGQGASGLTAIDGNICIGQSSGQGLRTGGNYNVIVGSGAGGITSGAFNILLGYGVTTPSATASYQLNIGNTIYGLTNTGIVGIGTYDLDGTPAIGRLTVKATTNDGSTNCLMLRDSDEANVAWIDSNGKATFNGGWTDGTTTILSGALTEVASITNAARDLNVVLTGAYSVAINVAGCTGTADGFFINDGTDYVKATHLGTNQLVYGIQVYTYEFDCETSALIKATTTMVLQSGTTTRLNSTNLGINTATFGTAMAGGIAILNGTAGSGTLADTTRMWSTDRGATAGKAALHIMAEDGTPIVLGDFCGINRASPTCPLDVQGYTSNGSTNIATFYDNRPYVAAAIKSDGTIIHNETRIIGLDVSGNRLDTLPVCNYVMKHTDGIALLDDEYFDLPDASCGWIIITIKGGLGEYSVCTIIATWGADGLVSIIHANPSATYVDNADTDTKFCIFDNGTTVRVRNRIGSTKTVIFEYHYIV